MQLQIQSTLASSIFMLVMVLFSSCDTCSRKANAPAQRNRQFHASKNTSAIYPPAPGAHPKLTEKKDKIYTDSREKGLTFPGGDVHMDVTILEDRRIFKAAINVEASDVWLAGLFIPKGKEESVVVNASNDDITMHGGGLCGAIGNWVKANGLVPFKSIETKLPSGQNPSSTILPAGQFALFPVSFGDIYLAVGPKAGDVKTLADTKCLLVNLYYQMLKKAHEDGRKQIVLCAISTAIFAGEGKEKNTGRPFSKQEFLDHVYAGMVKGIGQFQKEYPDHQLKIVLNNWDSKITAGVQALQ